ncbi:MAG: AI-2E family transporter [Verrucomicrobiota bacterium]|jgi:predicted PurR-regulated permease PerM
MNPLVEEPDAELRQEEGWWSRERGLALALVALTVLAIYLCYLLARPFLPALAWALALAVVAHPLHEWIEKRIPQPNVAAAFAVIIVGITLVAPGIFVVQTLVQEASSGLEKLQIEAQSGNLRAWFEKSRLGAAVLHWLEQQFDFGDTAKGAAKVVGERISSVLKGSFWGALELLVTFFILFYFFRDRRTALRALRSLVPLSNTETDRIFSRVVDTIYATIYGTLAVAFVQGSLGGLMFWWLGLPAPLLWGVVMGLLAIIPVLGTFVVWIPAAIMLAVQGAWLKALILTIWGAFVVGLIDNLLYPILVGKRLALHTLPVFIAIVGGLFLFGASGLILGPVVLAVTLGLIEAWRRRTADGGTVESGIRR